MRKTLDVAALSEPSRDWGGALRVVLALLVLAALLLMPGHPQGFSIAHFASLPLELPLIVLALLLLHARWSLAVRLVVVLVLAVLMLLRLADIGSYLAFDRRFSPLVELHLLGDGWNLASQSIGRWQAGLALLVAALALAGVCALLYLALRGIAAATGRVRQSLLVASVLVLLAGGVGLVLQAMITRVLPATLPVQASLAPELVERVQAMRSSIADQSEFIAQLAVDPVRARGWPQFAALEGRDVMVLFVESYGRSFVEVERSAARAATRLAAVNDTLVGAGLGAKSGWLTSTIRGGRSWLAHATFMSGLPITNQARFDRLISSGHRSLNRLFGQARWQTAGLMPAIQLDWPEGAWYGFEQNLVMQELGYRGEKFGWVTMPDQYTLSAFERLVRAPAKGPVMAEIALISSHAPWTPLPRIVPWDEVGDGSVFDGSHRFGDAPAWAEPELLRSMYDQSLDYSLQVIGEYLARHGDNALVVILGDHQPPSIINGWGKSADVPVHVVSDDPALLERLPAEYWSAGMTPRQGLASQPMESMREFLSTVFEAPLPASGKAVSPP